MWFDSAGSLTASHCFATSLNVGAAAIVSLPATLLIVGPSGLQPRGGHVQIQPAGIPELAGLFLGLCAFHLAGGEGHGIDLLGATGDTMIVGWFGQYRPGLSETNIDCKSWRIKGKK